MSNLINLENARLAYGTRTLLDGVSLGIGTGDRIGVVGRNGAGKSTLLEVLAGRRALDGGRVTHTRGLRVGYLTQHDSLDPASTVLAAAVAARPEHAWRSDPRMRTIVDVLLAGIELHAQVASLSGGERRRAALAGLLVDDPALLVLDEPTNHLDVDGVDWLARHLARRPGALVAVTHDRWFLDAVVEQTWEVADGAVHSYDGGYSAFVLAKAERVRAVDVAAERRRNLLRKELAWLRRGPPARTSKPQFRVDAANALIADEPPARDTVELVRLAGQRLGRSVLDVEDVTVELGGRPVLADVSWRLGAGDRFGVVGANGSGKTTLLRLLAGQLGPDRGVVSVGRTVRAAYLSQSVAELPEQLPVLEAVEQVKTVLDLGGGRELSARQLAERLGFTGERLWTAVSELSGGERRRLQLLRLLMDGPNVLLLDEPTNDLDVETLGALEDQLDSFAGTVVVVSHDRYFLERVCDRIVGLIGDGSVRDLPGGVVEYLALRAAEPDRTQQPDTSTVDVAAPAGSARARTARKQMRAIERRLDRLGEQIHAVHAQLAACSTDHVAVTELDDRLRVLLQQTSELEDQWLRAAELGSPAAEA